MNQKLLLITILGFCFPSCQPKEQPHSPTPTGEATQWDRDALHDIATQSLDSSKWDMELFAQDIETYNQYPEVFQSYPLNKSPFPVIEYDYAVASIPFSIEIGNAIFKGVRIGAYENAESEKIIDKLTLLVLTNDPKSEETTLVDSRNYPYLTAQGIFKVTDNELDWTFAASPDGFSILLLNMKLFDLRFGETIIIYPQMNKSFLYDQIEDSPNHYESFEDFKRSIANNPKVKHHIRQLDF